MGYGTSIYGTGIVGCRSAPAYRLTDAPEPTLARFPDLMNEATAVWLCNHRWPVASTEGESSRPY